MKSHCFYQGNKLSAIGSISEMSVMLQSSFAPLAEQRVGAIDNTVLIATNSASSIVHAAGATPYAPYGHFDLIRHGSVLGFNGQARDPVTHSDLLGNGKRVFSPSLMRFNSPDDLSPFGLGGVNAYAYCGGDPINFADPTGNVRHKNVLKRLESKRPRSLEPQRAPAAPTEVARPSQTVHGVASHPPSASLQQPTSSGATPTRPVLRHRMNGPFSSEEISYTQDVLQVAITDQAAAHLVLPFGDSPGGSFGRSRFMPELIAFIVRQARGGLSPRTMEAIFESYVPHYNTPTGRQLASQAQEAAKVAIASYRMRTGT